MRLLGNAARQADAWEQHGRPEAAAMRSLADVPQAFGFTSGTAGQVRRQVDLTLDAAGSRLAVLATYNVPGRDATATRRAAPAITAVGSTALPATSAAAGPG
jgi:hypothetical protein